MRAFSYQLTDDLRGTGVGVSLLVPSEVDSPYFDNNPGSRERIPGIAKLIGTMTEADVAAAAVRTIERRTAAGARAVAPSACSPHDAAARACAP